MMPKIVIAFLLLTAAALAQPETSVHDLVRDAVRAEEAEEIPRAIQLYQAALLQRPQLGDLWSQLGLLQMGQGDYQAARESLRKAAQLLPDPYPVQLDLARSYAWADQPEEALSGYSQILQSHPHSLEARLGAAAALAWLERWNESQAAYQEILAREPANVPAQLGLGNLWRAQQDWGQAAETYQQVLREDSADPGARLALARLHMDQRHWDLAQTELDKLLTTHPQDSPGYLLRSQLLERLVEGDRAEQDLNEALRWSPKSRQNLKALRVFEDEHRPALEPLFRHGLDSADNRLLSVGGRFSFDLDRNQRMAFHFEHQNQQNQSQGLATRVDLAQLSWRGRLTPDLSASAGLGLVSLPGSTQAVGGARLAWEHDSQGQLGFSYAGEVLTDTAQLVQNQVGLQQWGLDYRRSLSDDDTLEVAYQRGFFSDGNTRNLLAGSYFHQFHSAPNLSLGATARALDYAFASNAGYFSPAHFRTAEMVLRLDNHRLDDPWIYAFEGGLGRQWISGQSGQLVTHLSASLGYRVADWLDVEAGFYTSNSALSSLSGFSYTAETLQMKIRF